VTQGNSYFPAKMQSLLVDAIVVPAWPKMTTFPFASFAEELSEFFQEKIQISCSIADWKPKEQFFAGFGENPFLIALDSMPLQEPLYIMIPEEDTTKLSTWLIKEGEGGFGLQEKELQKGFLRFLILKALCLLERTSFLEDLSFHIKEKSLDVDFAYVIDIELKKSSSSKVDCRFLIPKSFQEAFTKHRAYLSSYKDIARLSKIELHCCLEIGQTVLIFEELESLQEGDFLILDALSFHPNTQEGSLQLTFATIALFHVSWKDAEVQILDYANYYEESMSEDFETPSKETEIAQETEALISSKKIPVTLRVEIARLSLTMEKILSLRPGDFLQLGIAPQSAVYLTINGKRVGRGELLQIEESVGVKVLEMGL